MVLESVTEMRVLAVKLDREIVNDHALKMSGNRQPLETATHHSLPTLTTAYDAVVRCVSKLWSLQQKHGASADSALCLPETIDDLYTHFISAMRSMEPIADEQAGNALIARAEEYLREHLDRPVSRAELAAATGVSIRTLSRAFGKRWGTGPMGFLKIRRMEAAYRDLLGAMRDETSVTQVASKYGFTHLGKFSVEYKRLFQESPSKTLALFG